MDDATDAALDAHYEGRYRIQAYDDGTWRLLADDGYSAATWRDGDRLLTEDEIQGVRW